MDVEMNEHGFLPLMKGEVRRGLDRRKLEQPPSNSPLHKGGESRFESQICSLCDEEL